MVGRGLQEAFGGSSVWTGMTSFFQAVFFQFKAVLMMDQFFNYGMNTFHKWGFFDYFCTTIWRNIFKQISVFPGIFDAGCFCTPLVCNFRIRP